MPPPASPSSPAGFDDEVTNRRVAALVQLRNTMRESRPLIHLHGRLADGRVSCAASMEDIASAAAKSPLTPAVVLEAQARYEAYADETEFMRASHNAHVGHEATQPARNGFTTRPPVAAEEDDLAEQARKDAVAAVPRFEQLEEQEEEHGVVPARVPGMHGGEAQTGAEEHEQPESARQGTPVSPENAQGHGMGS